MLIPSIRDRTRKAQRLLPSWLSPDKDVVKRVQLEKLRIVWTDAIKNVPYYKGLVESGQAPSEITSVEQFLAEVPKLAKKTIQNRRHEFVRLDRPADMTRATGGSTGEPLQFGVFNSELEEGSADALVGRLAHGMDLESDRFFILFGYSHLLGAGWSGRKNHLERKVRDWLMGYKRQDSYRLDKQTAGDILSEITRFNPHVLYGYSCAIDALVRLNRDRMQRALIPGLKVIIVTSEPLPREDSKYLIEQFFDVPVVSEYGGVDIGSVAYEKPDGNYGVFWWNQFAEVENDARGDNGGSLILTSLYVKYLPLIRYYSGDRVSGHQTLDHGVIEFKSLEGRINDMIMIGDTAIHSVAFAHCVKDESNIFSMQLVLERERLKLILVGTKDSEAEARIRRRLADLSPQLKDCRIQYAEDLETTVAGKRRWVLDRRNVPT
jgi:phenylacetate-CoA ligase